jgi:hypothetical protein
MQFMSWSQPREGGVAHPAHIMPAEQRGPVIIPVIVVARNGNCQFWGALRELFR